MWSDEQSLEFDTHRLTLPEWKQVMLMLFAFHCRTPGSQNMLAKKILEYVLAHIVEFKKLNQEPRMGGYVQEDDGPDY